MKNYSTTKSKVLISFGYYYGRDKDWSTYRGPPLKGFFIKVYDTRLDSVKSISVVKAHAPHAVEPLEAVAQFSTVTFWLPYRQCVNYLKEAYNYTYLIYDINP